MLETKIKNLESKQLSKKELISSADKICQGVPSVANNKKNMTKGLFEDGKVFYLNPTEELRMKDIVKKDSTTATVLGSGDFAIDSVYNGVNNVLTFDINQFQFFPASLKLKFLQNISYNEYCDFFSDDDNTKFLSLKTYDLIKSISRFNPDLYCFMDIILNRINEARKKVRENITYDPFYEIINEVYNGSMFNDTCLEEFIKLMDIKVDENATDLYLNFIFNKFGLTYNAPEELQILHGLATYKNRDNYLENEESYNKTSQLIRDSKIKFVNCDVSNLKTKLKEVGYLNSDFKGFQSIYLSNIPEYMSGEHFYSIVNNELMDLLLDDGIIAYCCQGITSKTLKEGKKQLDREEDEIEDFFADRNPLNIIQLKNDVEGYNLLRKKYDIALDESESISLSNGYEDKDTFVYVKKR